MSRYEDITVWREFGKGSSAVDMCICENIEDLVIQIVRDFVPRGHSISHADSTEGTALQPRPRVGQRSHPTVSTRGHMAHTWVCTCSIQSATDPYSP